VKWIVLFIAYLRDVREVRGFEAMSQVLSGVRFFWKKKGVDSRFFEDPIVTQAKKGARLTTDEIRESALVKEGDRFLPVFTEMVMQLLSVLTPVFALGMCVHGTVQEQRIIVFGQGTSGLDCRRRPERS
jgi:hypothetical protein